MASPSALPPASARDLAGLLREAYRRTAALAPGERRRAVELCLAYSLQGRDREAALRRVAEVQVALGGAQEPGPAPARGSPEGGVSLGGEGERALGAVVAGVLGRKEAARAGSGVQALVRAAEEWERVGERLAAARPTVPASASLEERVGELQERLSALDRALERTAQEFLDRLLDAFDPEAAKAYVGEKGIKPSSFYKASVYDALCEKFSQLRAYHDRGRLVRDFRATFKRYLKQGGSTE